MKREINLLPVELKEKRKTERIKSSAGSLSLIILAVAVISSLLLSAISVNFKLQQSSLKKESIRVRGKIDDLSVVESEALRLQSKLLSINKIIDDKNLYSKLLTNISKASPPEVTIVALSSFGEGRVSLTGTVQSYATLSKFITSLLDPTSAGKIFNAADLTGASLDEVSGKIRFSLVLHLVENSLK